MNVGDSPLTWTLGLSAINRIEDGTFSLVLPSGSPLILPPTNIGPPGEGAVGYLAPKESCRFSVQCSPGEPNTTIISYTWIYSPSWMYIHRCLIPTYFPLKCSTWVWDNKCIETCVLYVHMYAYTYIVYPPGHHGEFQAEIPLFLNGNMTQPYSSLTLTASVPVGRITVSTKCIALPPVPLGLTISAQYTLLVQDFPKWVHTYVFVCT